MPPLHGAYDQGRALGGGHGHTLGDGAVAHRAPVRSERPLVDLRLHEVGRDHRHRDALFRDFDSQRLEQTEDRVLAAGVGRPERHARESGHRRDNDDLTAGLLEMGESFVGQEYRPQIVDLHELLEDAEVGHLVEARVHAAARVVDEDVDPTPAQHGLPNEVSALAFVGDVGRDDDGSGSEGFTLSGGVPESRLIPCG